LRDDRRDAGQAVLREGHRRGAAREPRARCADHQGTAELQDGLK
jgi:hypothetical protein